MTKYSEEGIVSISQANGPSNLLFEFATEWQIQFLARSCAKHKDGFLVEQTCPLLLWLFRNDEVVTALRGRLTTESIWVISQELFHNGPYQLRLRLMSMCRQPLKDQKLLIIERHRNPVLNGHQRITDISS